MKKNEIALIGAVILLSILLFAAVVFPLSRPSEPLGPPILTGVPDVRQSTDYSCGAASLQAVLSYWGTDMREGVLMELLHTSVDNGTDPYDIVRVAEELGFNATLQVGLTVEDLAASVEEGVPVIIVAQAWTEDRGEGFSWADEWEDGHYMVVIGVDDDHVYLEDPALLGSRGKIPLNEFITRWHDFVGAAHGAPDAVVLEHMGIFIRGGSPVASPAFVPVR